MKKLLTISSFILLLISCKGEPVKDNKVTNDTTKVNGKTNAEKPDDIPELTSDNCYDYLTELVRSSNFPFSDWKIAPGKVNLLIDDDNDELVSCKLFYETNGTGTIGWIKYLKKEGKLYNTSANLENPVPLKYDSKWKKLWDACLLKQEKINPKDVVSNENGSIKGKQESRVSLPFDYENYFQTCISNPSSDCSKKYPVLSSSEYEKAIAIIGAQNGLPESIFSIQPTFENPISIYVLDYEGDSTSQDIITISNGKVVGHQSIGYAFPENKTFDSFIINPDMTIDVYEISYANHSKKRKKESYKISRNGSISKI